MRRWWIQIAMTCRFRVRKTGRWLISHSKWWMRAGWWWLINANCGSIQWRVRIALTMATRWSITWTHVNLKIVAIEFRADVSCREVNCLFASGQTNKEKWFILFFLHFEYLLLITLACASSSLVVSLFFSISSFKMPQHLAHKWGSESYSERKKTGFK